MSWLMLFLAGISEILWACAMKYSDGFTNLVPSIITVIGYIASAVFLSLALKALPFGVAYAIWTGFGIVGTAILGVVLFGESLSIAQIVCIVMITAGIIGLKVL